MNLLVAPRSLRAKLGLSKYVCGLQQQQQHQQPQLAYRRSIYHNPAYFHQPGKDSLLYRNVGQQLRRAAEKYGQRPALISCAEQKRLSFEDIREEAGVLAHQLLSMGLQSGDHVGLWVPNTTQFYIGFMAAALVGMPVACINPALQAPELESALDLAHVKALICMDTCGRYDFIKVLEQIVPELKHNQPLAINPKFSHLKTLIVKSPKTWQAAHNYDVLVKERAPHSHNVAFLYVKAGKIPAESTCNIQYTSGSTGQPKVALSSHFSSVNQARYFGTCLELQAANRRICCNLPLFHAFGLSLLLAALDYGATLVLPSESFSAAASLEAIEQQACNVILGTPTMYVDLLEKQTELKRCMDSLELGLVGGAPAAPQLIHQVRNTFGLKSMKIGYGLTESTAAIFAQDSEDALENAGQTVGRLCGHGEAKVINENGETVNFGERGELCVRGFFNMKGYLEDEQRTQEVLLKDGWLRTGDEFVLEEDGSASIVGRKKDVIIRGGENIFPKQIEDILQQHQDILEVQAIGVPSERLGEEICVYLRLRSDAPPLTTEQVHEFCKARLAHFKVPRYVRVVNDFPKTVSGKIQKFKLKEMFSAEGQS